MRAGTPRRRPGGCGGPAPLATLAVPVALAALAALTALTGCEIAKPELPRFTTTLTVPLGTQHLTVAELVEGEYFLTVGADSSLGFLMSGEAETLSVEVDLTADLPRTELAATLGAFALPAGEAAAFAFALGDLYPAAQPLAGQSVPVAPLAFDLASPPADLADVESATVASGRLVLSVHNGLPVPVAGETPPLAMTVSLVDPATGRELAAATLAEPLPAGGDAVVAADLAGVTLPDSVSVRLTGGSPGSAAPVAIDPAASLGIAAALEEVRVTRARAVIGEQAFTSAASVPLPDSLRVVSAEIVAGALDVSLANALAVPARADLTLPQLLDADGRAVRASFDLAPGASAVRRLDLAGGRVQAPDGEPLSALTVDAAVTTPGSAGLAVDLAASDALAAAVAPAHLSFGAVTGEIPERQFAVGPLQAAIDLPDELTGVALTAARLVVSVRNGTGVPGRLAFTLSGRSAAGAVVALDGAADVAPAARGDEAGTEIVLDETNSAALDFLNNLPVEVTLTGSVTVGGPGALGTVRPGDQAVVGWRLDAPLAVVVAGATVRGDPQPLNLDDGTRDELERRLGAARVTARLTNHLPLAVQIRLLAGTDPQTLAQSPELVVGPLAAAAGTLDPERGTVTAAVVSVCEAALTAEQAAVLARPGLHTLVEVTVPSTGGRTVLVRAGDYLNVAGALCAELVVDEEE